MGAPIGGALKQSARSVDIGDTVLRRIAALLTLAGALALPGSLAHAADPRRRPTADPAGRDPVALAQQRLDEVRDAGDRHLRAHLGRADPAGQARGRDRRRRGQDPGAAGQGGGAAGPGEGTRRAALRAATAGAPRSSRRWRPRTPRTACAPRTSPTPSASRTSTRRAELRDDRGEARGTRSRPQAAARRPREDDRRPRAAQRPAAAEARRSRAMLYDKVHALVVDGRAEARRRRRHQRDRVPGEGRRRVHRRLRRAAARAVRIPGIDMGALTETPVVAVRRRRSGVTTSAARAATARGSPASTTSPTTTRTSRSTRTRPRDCIVRGRGDRLRRHDRQRDRPAPPLRDPSRQAGREASASIRSRRCSRSVQREPAGGEARTNVVAVPPGWRNWLTQSAQNRPPFGACGFESHSGHRDRVEVQSS